jgi:hypothetical protein
MVDQASSVATSSTVAMSGVSRRNFALMGAAAVAALGSEHAFAAVPDWRAPDLRESPDLRELAVRIPTADGIADGVFVHPAAGRHPAVVLWADAAGMRGEAKDVARRLAGAGFSVLLVDPHYRVGGAADRGATAVRQRMTTSTDGNIHRDGKAFSAWIVAQRATDPAAGAPLLRSARPDPSWLAPRGRGATAISAHLIATPRQRDRLSPGQRDALDGAIRDMHHLADLGVRSALRA